MDLEPDGIVGPDHDLATGGGDPVVQDIEAMLAEDRVEEALAAIDAALRDGRGSALDLEFLRGDASLLLARGADAERSFRAVLERDPDCPSSRCWLAMSLFVQWRFDEAEQAANAALEVPDPLPDVDVVLGAVIERRGEDHYPLADEHFQRAAAAMPEKYARPVRMTRDEFDREVKRAARKLPRQFRQCLDRVRVILQDLPDDGLGERDDEEGLAPDLLGLFDGVPLPESSEYDFERGPNTIYLFQRNLERMAFGRDDLVEQIRITLWHELGHYLGFDEEDMDDLGLA